MKILVEEYDLLSSKEGMGARYSEEVAVCLAHGIDYDKSKKIDHGKKIIQENDYCFYAYVTEIVNPVRIQSA